MHPWEAKEEVENCAKVGEQVASVVIVVGFLVEKMVKMVENGDNHEKHPNDGDNKDEDGSD